MAPAPWWGRTPSFVLQIRSGGGAQTDEVQVVIPEHRGGALASLFDANDERVPILGPFVEPNGEVAGQQAVAHMFRQQPHPAAAGRPIGKLNLHVQPDVLGSPTLGLERVLGREGLFAPLRNPPNRLDILVALDRALCVEQRILFSFGSTRSIAMPA